MWLCGIWRAFEERVILFLKNEKREKEKEKILLRIVFVVLTIMDVFSKIYLVWTFIYCLWKLKFLCGIVELDV